MAKSATYTKETNGYTLTIDVREDSYDASANTSEVYFYFKIESTNYDFSHQTKIRVYINDRYVYEDTRTVTIGTYDSAYLATGTVTVPHDSDGTKKCEVFAELVFINNPGAYYLPQDPVIAEHGRTGYMFELTPLNQLSIDFKSIGITTLGKQGRIIFDVPEPNKYWTWFGYKIEHADGTASQWVYPHGSHSVKADYIDVAIPLSAAEHTTNSSQVKILLWVAIYTEYTTNYKSNKAVKFKEINLTVPNTAGPSIKEISVTEGSDLIKALFNYFIAGYSKLKIHCNISGQYNATIVKTQIEVLGQTYNGNDTTVDIPPYGYNPASSTVDIPIVVKSIDSRGITSTQTKVISVYRYSTCKIQSATAYFNDSGHGEVKVSHTSFSINSTNTTQILVRYKRQSETEWKDITVTPSKYNGSDIIEIRQITPNNSWNIRVIYSDTLTEQVHHLILNSLSNVYVTFITDELNQTLPQLPGPNVTIPADRLYKSYNIDIVNETPETHKVHLSWEHNVAKQFIKKWIDKSTSQTYELGQTITIVKSITLHPVLEEHSSDVALPIVTSCPNDVKLVGYSKLKDGGITYNVVHTLKDIKENIILYTKFKAKFTISANGGTLLITENNTTTSTDEFVKWKYNWGNLDLSEYTFNVSPPEIANPGAADGEQTSDFIGWSSPIPQIYQENTPLLIKALWKKKTFTVRFYIERGGQLLKEIHDIPYGTGVTPPPDPKIKHKIFRGWSNSFDNIKINKDIYGIWESANIWIMSKDHIWVPYLPKEE